MFFITYDYYDINNDDFETNTTKTLTHEDSFECFICFEKNIHNEPIQKLKNQIIYIKQCDCNVWVHNSCLQKWFELNKKCPICCLSMTKNNNYVIHYFKEFSFIMKVYRFYSRNSIKITKIISMVFIWYIVFVLFLNTLNIYNEVKQYDDYHLHHNILELNCINKLNYCHNNLMPKKNIYVYNYNYINITYEKEKKINLITPS